jgi:hypothetical protein
MPVSLLWASEKRKDVAVIPVPPGAQPPSDESLMAALKERQADALAELFRRYSRLVFTIGLRILEDAGEAEEIVQDDFRCYLEGALLGIAAVIAGRARWYFNAGRCLLAIPVVRTFYIFFRLIRMTVIIVWLRGPGPNRPNQNGQTSASTQRRIIDNTDGCSFIFD